MRGYTAKVVPDRRNQTTKAEAARLTKLASEAKPFVDYSSQLKLNENKTARLLLRLAGLFFLGLGILGYILPGLPGTVFILIAAYMFARSSPKFYNRIMNHPVFGTWVRDFQAGKGIPLWLKFYAPSMIALFSTGSIVYFARTGPVWWAIGCVAVVAIYGIWYILRLPTRRPPER